MKKHINIPVFIPMMGCPYACIYCNQTEISGHNKPDFSNIEKEIEKALENTNPQMQDIQIAFFGGSFTGIDRCDMIFLLEIANKFIKEGRVHSIRCSTRPDFIDDEIIEILKKYNMKTVELGVQSANNDVLKICRRGHTIEQTRKAASLIVKSGIEFVGQMMIGLPSSSKDDEIRTAKEIIKMGAVGARIYPCVVMKNTYLAKMANTGLYTPLTLDEEIDRCESVFEEFIKSNVDVIRIGLQSSENLTSGEDVECGIYDESIGEKCIALYFLKQVEKAIENEKVDGKYVRVSVSPKRISNAVGYKKQNRKYLFRKYHPSYISFEGDESLSEFEIKVDISEQEK